MGATTELVEALNALSSKANATPAEVLREFNDLLRRSPQEIAENHLSILEKFHPLTRIGRVLRIRLVDRCRVRSEILKLLQSGDSLDTNQALKCRWFFTELEEPGNFVNHVLPTFSLSVRLKVINRYAAHLENTSAGEDLYLSVKARYGVRDAVLALPACSENFIRDELPNLNMLNLRPNMVDALLEKYPSLATEYLSYIVDKQAFLYKRHGCYTHNYHYESSFYKLSQKNLQAFIDMRKKHGPSLPFVALGRRTVKRCIRQHFDDVLTNYDQCKSIVTEKKFNRRLSFAQMKSLICCMLPPTLTDFFALYHWDHVVEVLKEYRNSDVRSSLFKEAFQSKYGRDVFAYLSKLGDHWMNMIPVERRTEKVNLRLTGVDNPREQAEVLAYLPVDESMPRLKKLIENQSDSEVRASIAGQMIRTLKHNKHPQGVTELFTYFNRRFRNETRMFRALVLAELVSINKMLLLLEIEHWTPVDSFIDIMRLNKELVRLELRFALRILKTQIHCYFLRNQDIEPLLQKYFEFMMLNEEDVGAQFLELCENQPYVGLCAELFLKKISKVNWKSNRKLSFIVSVLKIVGDLKMKERTEGSIVLSDELIGEIEAVAKDPELADNPEMEKMLRHAQRIPELRDRVLKVAFPTCAREGVPSRILRIDPVLLRDNLERMSEITFKRNFRWYRSFYAKCRMYESYGIPQLLADICRAAMKNVEVGSPLEQTPLQCHAVQVLSMILHPVEYAELVSTYTPTRATIEGYSPEEAEMLVLQKAVCQSFINVSRPSAMLPVLRKFTVGDYLKIAVGAMNAVYSRVPENVALPVLKDWTDCPISLRKHVLRLVYRLSPVEQSTTAFIELFKTERNSSIRLVIFLEIHKKFLTDPSDQTFNAVSALISLLTDGDEVLKDLFSVQFMSDAYISRYLKSLWDSIPKWESAIPNGKDKLIKCIDKWNIECLDEHFCQELLSYEVKKLPSPLSDFVYLCVLHRSSADSLLRTVISAVTPSIQDKWDERTTEPGPVFRVHRMLSDFVDKLCSKTRDCEDKRGAAGVLSRTRRALGELTSLRNSLRIFFWLDAHIVFLNLQNDQSFESALAGLYRTYVERYESVSPHSLVAVLSNVVPKGLNASRTKLAHELVQTEVPLCQMLAARIAETKITCSEELPLFNQIVEALLSSAHPDVQTAATLYFEKLESSAIV